LHPPRPPPWSHPPFSPRGFPPFSAWTHPVATCLACQVLQIQAIKPKSRNKYTVSISGNASACEQLCSSTKDCTSWSYGVKGVVCLAIDCDGD
jgi:hypothetical protein